jgi:hypothetical protein
VSTIINEDKNAVRRYLLGQLEGADEERLELRLLADPSFSEEFDTVVDEIADQYAGNDLGSDEKKLVEQYFLRSAQHQQKVDFARELLQRAVASRGSRRDAVGAEAGFIARLLAFWRSQSFALRTAATIATIVIVAGIAYQISRREPAGTLAVISLTISTSDRGSGSEVKSVKLDPGNRGVRIELTLPEQAPQAQDYRIELIDDQKRSRNLPIKERTDKLLVVEIPADEINRGSYIIQLHGDERRIRGSYFFNIQ